MRLAKTFSVEESLLEQVERTRAGRSASERINELLKRGLEQERRHKLELEAKQFYAQHRSKDSKEKKAFQKASIRSLARD